MRHEKIWEKIVRATEELRLRGHPSLTGLSAEQAIHWFTRNLAAGIELLRQYREALSEAIRNPSDEPVTVKQDVDPFSAHETPSFRELRSFAEEMHKADRDKFPTVESAYVEARKKRPHLVEKHRDELEKMREARTVRSFAEMDADERAARAADEAASEISAGGDPVRATGRAIVRWR